MGKVTPEGLPVVSKETYDSVLSDLNDPDQRAYLDFDQVETENHFIAVAMGRLSMQFPGKDLMAQAGQAMIIIYKLLRSQGESNKIDDELGRNIKG